MCRNIQREIRNQKLYYPQGEIHVAQSSKRKREDTDKNILSNMMHLKNFYFFFFKKKHVKLDLEKKKGENRS